MTSYISLVIRVIDSRKTLRATMVSGQRAMCAPKKTGMLQRIFILLHFILFTSDT
jgi:hypothetical protein